MKRGIKFRTVESEPSMPVSFKGIPVVFSPYHRGVCDARGFMYWKRIMIGPLFNQFDGRIQTALLLHEARHCLMWHLEQRVFLLCLIFAPILFLSLREVLVAIAVGLLAWL